VPSQRPGDVPVQVPLRYWLVGGSAVAVSVSVSGFGPGCREANAATARTTRRAPAREGGERTA
jgi:hypothetical protein